MKMGRPNVVLKLVVLVLLFVFLFSTCSATYGRLGLATLPLVELQEHEQNKLEKRSVAGRSNGGRRGGIGGEGGNGGSGMNSSPNLQGGGGAAVIPVYTAGAGSNMHRNKHHSSGNCVQSFWGSTAIAAILLLAYLTF